jgi:hypothetical protein
MMAAGIETLGVGMVDTADVDGVLASGGSNLRVGNGPRIMSIIHTPNDSMAELRVADVVRATSILERTIRTLDRADLLNLRTFEPQNLVEPSRRVQKDPACRTLRIPDTTRR